MNPSPGVYRARHPWPPLPFKEWKDTVQTLHMWSQIVGKVRLVQSPWLNHSWHVPFYVNARGFTTSAIPYGPRSFEVQFDLIDQMLLVINTSDGMTRNHAFEAAGKVADLLPAISLTHLAELRTSARPHPSISQTKSPVAIPFERRHGPHASYDRRSRRPLFHRCWSWPTRS